MRDADEAHIPVLLREVCDALAPCFKGTRAPSPRVFVDATCGLGGHAQAVIERLGPSTVVALDRDAQALGLAKQRLAAIDTPVEFVHTPFATIAQTLRGLGIGAPTAILADLGVSSLQLDTPERGFSFRGPGPLDMRMDPSTGVSAAEFLSNVDSDELVDILRKYGEEPDARRIAAAIVAARPTTTLALAQVVTDAMSSKQRRRLGKRIHPATRTFQALRIHLNRELEQLERFLNDAPQLLANAGRLAVITFHSLEDRAVKRHFRALSRPPQLPPGLPIVDADVPRPDFVIPPALRSGVTAGPEEITANARARSARLRVLERVEN